MPMYGTTCLAEADCADAAPKLEKIKNTTSRNENAEFLFIVSPPVCDVILQVVNVLNEFIIARESRIQLVVHSPGIQ